MNHEATQLLVKTILEHATSMPGRWTLQGLGMLRLYLSPTTRLHVWSMAHRNPMASTLHTHPWDFSSYVVVGSIENTTYEQAYRSGVKYNRQLLRCGEGGGLEGTPDQIRLESSGWQVNEGELYEQAAEVIHETDFWDGTVTLVQRTMRADTEHAYVFWRDGQTWGSAEPREATPEEVEAITGTALRRYFSA